MPTVRVPVGRPTAPLDHRRAARSFALLNPRRRYHRAEITFADRIPATGGAVLVGNHGRLDLDCFILAGLILHARVRVVRLLADHLWFTLPGVSRLWSAAGAVDGTRENALRLLKRGELVLTYPGGVREIMGGRFGSESVDWEGRTGFAAVAIAAGVPVIPVLGIGVNNGHVFISSGRLLGKVLFRKILRLGPGYEDYRDPLTIGLLPILLPFSLAVHFPWPCKLRYIVGEPIHPADASADAADTDPAAHLAGRAAEAMRDLIARYGKRA
jgi:1-acyl-sn-glycerol-3-phosphate acyltransferase